MDFSKLTMAVDILQQLQSSKTVEMVCSMQNIVNALHAIIVSSVSTPISILESFCLVVWIVLHSARNNKQPLAIFQAISTFGWPNLLYIFEMGQELITYKSSYVQNDTYPISGSCIFLLLCT